MIYVHIPFCRSFCTYCSFYSEIARSCKGRPEGGSEELFEAYADSICKEAAAREAEIRDTSEVNTLYIGGGTPSVFPLLLLRRISDSLGRIMFPDGNGRFGEFTVEVNPEDIVEKGTEYVRGLVEMGVNRVSMGVQSFDDGILKWMNRRHNAAGAEKAFRMLREGGIRNISIDLIFGISLLSDETWARTLERALELGPEHISAYQLSVEAGSALEGMSERGDYREAPEEDCARQYAMLCRTLEAAGMEHYEVSNFAVRGFAARHNSAYWRRVPYAGLGSAAHSLRITMEESGPLREVRHTRSWNSDSVPEYSSSSEILSGEDIRVENIMLALRTREGIDADYLRSHCREEVVERLFAVGSLAHSGNRIRIPENRFFVSDDIIRELI